MDYEEAVAEFLSQPENFRLALEVAQRLEDADLKYILPLVRNGCSPAFARLGLLNPSYNRRI